MHDDESKLRRDGERERASRPIDIYLFIAAINKSSGDFPSARATSAECGKAEKYSNARMNERMIE